MIARRPIVRVVPVRLPIVVAWVVALTCFGAAVPQNPASDGNLSVDVRSDAGQLRGVRDPTG